MLRSSSAGAATPATLVFGAPAAVGMRSERIERVFARVQRRVNDGLFPGATAPIARRGMIVGHRAFGNEVDGGTEPVTLDTMFDVLSIAKVLATAPAVMLLAQQGRLRLSDLVASYLPDFAANGKAHVTVFDMLRFSAGPPVDNQHLRQHRRDRVLRRDRGRGRGRTLSARRGATCARLARDGAASTCFALPGSCP